MWIVAPCRPYPYEATNTHKLNVSECRSVFSSFLFASQFYVYMLFSTRPFIAKTKKSVLRNFYPRKFFPFIVAWNCCFGAMKWWYIAYVYVCYKRAKKNENTTKHHLVAHNLKYKLSRAITTGNWPFIWVSVARRAQATIVVRRTTTLLKWAPISSSHEK